MYKRQRGGGWQVGGAAVPRVGVGLTCLAPPCSACTLRSRLHACCPPPPPGCRSTMKQKRRRRICLPMTAPYLRSPVLLVAQSQEHYETEKKKADARAEFEAEQAYLRTLSLLRLGPGCCSCFLRLSCLLAVGHGLGTRVHLRLHSLLRWPPSVAAALLTPARRGAAACPNRRCAPGPPRPAAARRSKKSTGSGRASPFCTCETAGEAGGGQG